MSDMILTRWSPLALATALLVSGCSLTPHYERPAAPVATAWPASAGAQPEGLIAAAELPWQQFVQDEQLRQLVAVFQLGKKAAPSHAPAVRAAPARAPMRAVAGGRGPVAVAPSDDWTEF